MWISDFNQMHWIWFCGKNAMQPMDQINCYIVTNTELPQTKCSNKHFVQIIWHGIVYNATKNALVICAVNWRMQFDLHAARAYIISIERCYIKTIDSYDSIYFHIPNIYESFHQSKARNLLINYLLNMKQNKTKHDNDFMASFRHLNDT